MRIAGVVGFNVNVELSRTLNLPGKITRYRTPPLLPVEILALPNMHRWKSHITGLAD